MRKLILSLFFVGCMVGLAHADFEYTISSYTSVITSGAVVASTNTAMNVSTRAYRIDGIAVTFPGTSSFVEVWDWKNSTGNGTYLGKYDTTSKVYFPFGHYGVDLSTGIVIYNQGTTPAGIRIDYRPKYLPPSVK